MAKSRKELAFDTLPEMDNDIDIDVAVDESVTALERAAKKRRALRRKDFVQPEDDMAPALLQMDANASKSDLALQGVTDTECDRLLRSLGVQASVQLTKNDTFNLLARLLGCTETQISAMLGNQQMPLAIKIVLKRLMMDYKTGNTEYVEKLWDRIFGKGPLREDLPNTGLVESSILPSHPMSREAYAIVVKKLM